MAVNKGGTAAATFTANGILYGAGTSPVQATAAGTTGQIFVGSTGAAPAWAATSTLFTSGISLLPSGTSGQTLYHTGSVWAASSNLFNNNTNVGIATNTPTLGTLDVNGSLAL